MVTSSCSVLRQMTSGSAFITLTPHSRMLIFLMIYVSKERHREAFSSSKMIKTQNEPQFGEVAPWLTKYFKSRHTARNSLLRTLFVCHQSSYLVIRQKFITVVVQGGL